MYDECKHMRGLYEFILYLKHYAKNINIRKIHAINYIYIEKEIKHTNL